MKINVFILFLLLWLTLSKCSAVKDVNYEQRCKTKYPIVLVHGVAFRDDFPVIHYWSKLPKVLEKNGAKVFLAHQDAFNSYVENALQLRERILGIMNETGAQKVNLIAHSKGGPDARYMISKLGMADKIASLTTLASPHRGSFLADTILTWLNKKKWVGTVVNAANFYSRVLGDENPDALIAAKNLTIEYMKDFNQSVLDAPNVYYQSYGGVVSNDYPAWIIRIQHRIMTKAEGENDAVVSKKSYQWGDFKGVVSSEQDFGVSHFDIVGMKFVSKQSTFDAENFIIEIAMNLKYLGF